MSSNSDDDDDASCETKQLTEMSHRGRKESEPLKISRRSNSLAFERRHWTSQQLPVSTTIVYSAEDYSPEPHSYSEEARPATLAKVHNLHSSLYNIHSSTGIRKGYTFTLPYYSQPQNPTTKQRQVVRSLLPPDNSALHNNYKHRGSRRDEDHKGRLKRSKSTGSQITNHSPIRSPKPPQKLFITSLPTEILNQIMDSLDQKDVLALMQTNKGLVEIAADYIYHYPKFASTYRFAQFVHTISHEKHYALRVRHLDVSYFTEVPQLQRTPMAGWREWKYRSHSLYRPPHKLSLPPKKPRKRPSKSIPPRRGHPGPNPFLESWATSRDIPLGGLCHCLQACENLRVVNLSRCQLAEDHLVQDAEYPADAWTGRIFVSDVPKSWTWKSDELRAVYNMYVVEQLVGLGQLETIIAANWVGLSTGMVRELVNRGQESLERVDFVGSGLEKEKAWAIKGSRKEVQEIIREMDEADPKKKIVSPKSSP